MCHYLRFSTSCFLRGDDGAADNNLSASGPFPLQNTQTTFIRTFIINKRMLFINGLVKKTVHFFLFQAQEKSVHR